MRNYLKQNPNKVTRKWIGLFTEFHAKEGRLPTDEEMAGFPVTIERDVALEIVKERLSRQQ